MLISNRNASIVPQKVEQRLINQDYRHTPRLSTVVSPVEDKSFTARDNSNFGPVDPHSVCLIGRINVLEALKDHTSLTRTLFLFCFL